MRRGKPTAGMRIWDIKKIVIGVGDTQAADPTRRPGPWVQIHHHHDSAMEVLITAQAHGWSPHQWAAGVLQAAATAIQRKLPPTCAHSNGLEVQQAPAMEQNEDTQICTATL
jgi:hypothetical protein